METDHKNFITDLLDELKDVFISNDIEMIEKTRIITDWNSLALKVRDRSFPIVHALEKDKFANIYAEVLQTLMTMNSKANSFCSRNNWRNLQV